MSRRDLIKKGSLILALFSFSLQAFADNGGSDPSLPTIYTFIENILQQDLGPLLGIATYVSYFIGLCMIIAGMSRLYRHGSGAQNMMHRASPMSTFFYFVSGIMLVSYMPYLQMFSNSIFGLDPQSEMLFQCQHSYAVITAPVGFYTGSAGLCPMTAYSLDISNDPNQSVGDAIKYLMYGVLFLVGVISFIRGMVHLVKMSEGGQGGGVGKALTHILAGIVAINAGSFYNLMENVLINNASS